MTTDAIPKKRRGIFRQAVVGKVSRPVTIVIDTVEALDQRVVQGGIGYRAGLARWIYGQRPHAAKRARKSSTPT